MVICNWKYRPQSPKFNQLPVYWETESSKTTGKHISKSIFPNTRPIFQWIWISSTVKHEYLAATIFGGFSKLTIWQRINLVISNFGISKKCDNFIWWWLILANLKNSPISPNKLLPINNRFIVSGATRFSDRMLWCNDHLTIRYCRPPSTL